MRPTISALALAMLVHSGRASELVYSVTIPDQPAPWNHTANLTAFDPAYGILRSVEITVSGFASGTYGLENTSASPSSTPFNVFTLIHATVPSGNFLPPPNPAFEYTSPTVAAFDGSVDFSGASAVSGSFANETGTGSPSNTIAIFQTPQLPAYIGPIGMPGTIAIGLNVDGVMTSGNAPWFSHTETLSIRAIVRVKYTYDVLPTTFCYSASWDGCPCGNTGAFGHGCANSLDADGGLLGFGGSASLSNDTLVLSGSDMTNAAALYFQGSSMQYVGAQYGDGLSCVGGSLVRLGLVLNSSGASSVPAPGNPPLSVHGGITTPGTVRYYQAQYRNAQPFCTSATFNATNGIAIAWGP